MFKKMRTKEQLTDLIDVIKEYRDKSGIRIFIGINKCGDLEADVFKRSNSSLGYYYSTLISDPLGPYSDLKMYRFDHICKEFLKKNKVARRWFRRNVLDFPYMGKTLKDFLLPSGEFNEKYNV